MGAALQRCNQYFLDDGDGNYNLSLSELRWEMLFA